MTIKHLTLFQNAETLLVSYAEKIKELLTDLS